MEKILELIEQVRFAELKKIHKYNPDQENFLEQNKPDDQL